MNRPLRFALSYALLSSAALGGCGSGTSENGSTTPTPTRSPEPDASASSDAASPTPATSDDAGACADLTLTDADTSCARNEDCSLVVQGEICPGYYIKDLCFGGAANSAGVAHVNAVLASVPQTDAGTFVCDVVGDFNAQCLAGQCAMCCDNCGGLAPPCAGDAGDAAAD